MVLVNSKEDVLIVTIESREDKKFLTNNDFLTMVGVGVDYFFGKWPNENRKNRCDTYLLGRFFSNSFSKDSH